MHVVEIFLPLTDNEGQPFAGALFHQERVTLTAKFDGVTVYSRSPAAGFWKDDQTIVKDDIVIFEVVAATIDAQWWASYRAHLELTFCQEVVLIRVFDVRVI